MPQFFVTRHVTSLVTCPWRKNSSATCDILVLRAGGGAVKRWVVSMGRALKERGREARAIFVTSEQQCLQFYNVYKDGKGQSRGG